MLDVKTDDGHFKVGGRAALARTMVKTGSRAGRDCNDYTGMGQPLGKNVGNALEVERRS